MADAFATPVIGYLSDRTRTRWGSRRPWHLLGCVAVAASFPALFSRPPSILDRLGAAHNVSLRVVAVTYYALVRCSMRARSGVGTQCIVAASTVLRPHYRAGPQVGAAAAAAAPCHDRVRAGAEVFVACIVVPEPRVGAVLPCDSRQVVVVFQLGWAASQVAHMAMCPELSPDFGQRTELNSMRYAATVSWRGRSRPRGPGSERSAGTLHHSRAVAQRNTTAELNPCLTFLCAFMPSRRWVATYLFML